MLLLQQQGLVPLPTASLVSSLATGSSDMTAIPLAPKPVILAVSGRLSHNKNNVLSFKTQSRETRVAEVELSAHNSTTSFHANLCRPEEGPPSTSQCMLIA